VIPKRHPLDALDEVVDRFGGSVRDPDPMPRHDLFTPAADGPAQRAHLGWHRRITEILGELIDEVAGEGRVVDVVDRADGLLGVPHHADLTTRIPGSEQTPQLRVAALVETFMGLRGEPPGAIQGIVLAATVTERFVLNPPSVLIQLGVRQSYDVEGVGDLGGVGQHDIEGLAIRAREVQGGPLHLVPPLGWLARSQPIGPAAVRPSTTSNNWPRPTSTIWVVHCWRRHRPSRQRSVSSRPSAVTSPNRPGSSTSAWP
jgi:hypothetical protein